VLCSQFFLFVGVIIVRFFGCLISVFYRVAFVFLVARYLHLGGFVRSFFALGWRVGLLVFLISVGMCSLHCVGLRRLMIFSVVLNFFIFYYFSGDVWGQAPIWRCFLGLSCCSRV
jgi:hypothetical protein